MSENKPIEIDLKVCADAESLREFFEHTNYILKNSPLKSMTQVVLLAVHFTKQGIEEKLIDFSEAEEEEPETKPVIQQ